MNNFQSQTGQNVVECVLTQDLSERESFSFLQKGRVKHVERKGRDCCPFNGEWCIGRKSGKHPIFPYRLRTGFSPNVHHPRRPAKLSSPYLPSCSLSPVSKDSLSLILNERRVEETFRGKL